MGSQFACLHRPFGDLVYDESCFKFLSLSLYSSN